MVGRFGKVVRVAAGLTLVGGLVGGAARGAAPVVPRGCEGRGTLRVFHHAPGTPLTWTVAGSGKCVNAQLGAPILNVQFAGRGESDNLGRLCDDERYLVTNLLLNVRVDFRAPNGSHHTVEKQQWAAPLTTFPIATVFVVSSSTGANGAGIAIHRVLLTCANGNPSATFAWAQL